MLSEARSEDLGSEIGFGKPISKFDVRSQIQGKNQSEAKGKAEQSQKS
jgi:hypothetical protein